MARCLCGTKALPEILLVKWTMNKFSCNSKRYIKYLHENNCNWKGQLENVGHFAQELRTASLLHATSYRKIMMTSSNRNIIRVTGHLCTEFAGYRFPHKGQWRRTLMFSLICARINGWASNREAGDLRGYRAHYDVTVISREVVSSGFRVF